MAGSLDTSRFTACVLLLFVAIPCTAVAAGEGARASVHSARSSSPILSRSGGRYGYTRYGAMASTSQVVSAYAGAALKFDPYESEKILVLVDVGVNGAKVKIGIPNVSRRADMWTSNLCASYLYAWNDALGMIDKNRNYLGIEWEEQLTVFPVQLGIYLGLGGDDGDSRVLASLGVGFGL